MNNKILIAIIAGLVIIGGVLVISGQFGDKTKLSDKDQLPTTRQNDTDAAKGKPITEAIDTITLTSSGFEPQSVSVKKNKVVIWINKTGAETAVKSNSFAPLNLGRFPDGSSVQLIFDKAGTYKYYNELSPDQTGTVIVE